MPSIAAPDFSLQATLASGQAFRWSEYEGWFYGFIGQALVKVRQEGAVFAFESSDPAVTQQRISRYFALDIDYPSILSSINIDMQVHQAIQQYRGLRILRQDSWETLAAFICSSFNNIKRIEGMIGRLCQAFGKPVALEGYRGFAFPHPEAVAGASERKLRSLGLGYRAPYLRKTARLVADNKLPIRQLQRLDYLSVKSALLACDGVGDKVADCVALFGFEKYEAFPVDVWMERAMRYYFRHQKITRKRIHDYAHARYGAWAGYAQQFLFHYVRNRGGKFQEHPLVSVSVN